MTHTFVVCQRCRGGHVEAPGVFAVRRPCRSCGGRGTLPVGARLWMPAMVPVVAAMGVVFASAWQCSVCWTRVPVINGVGINDRGGGPDSGPPEECPHCGARCAPPGGRPQLQIMALARVVVPTLIAEGN